MPVHLDIDELADQLRLEFRDDAQDRLDAIHRTLDKHAAGTLADRETLVLLRREAGKLRAIGSSCGFPLVSLIAHRLEVYLDGTLTRLTDRQLADVTRFADRLGQAVDLDQRGDGPHVAEIVSESAGRLIGAPLIVIQTL